MSARDNKKNSSAVADKSFIRGRFASRFEKTGEGPVVHGVRVQYSCGMEGFKALENTYGTRRKGYGRPKHSWGSLFRVFTYFKEDMPKVITVVIITLLSIGINLLGTFLSAPLVDALLTPASMVSAGASLRGGGGAAAGSLAASSGGGASSGGSAALRRRRDVL